MPKLSERMQFIFSHLIPDKPVWDFCCDHGYMGLKAYHSGAFPEIHFVDQVPHIIAKLEKTFHIKHHRPEFSQQAFFWAQSGEYISAPLKGTVIIAGVGAHTILQILRGLFEREGTQASRFILVPQKDEELLQQELELWETFKSHYQTAVVTQVQEGSRIRKVLIFDKIL